jgi:outer membrane protein with beta-barrel domain
MRRKTSWTGRAALAAALAGLAAPAPALEYGLGTGFLNNGSQRAVSVLTPMRTDSVMIEPEGQFSSSSSAASGRSHSLDVGAGLYGRRPLAQQLEAYLGGRLLRTTSKDESGGTTTKSNGWDLAPTVGVQYFLSRQFSVGLDAGLHYTTTETKVTGGSMSSQHGWNTEGRILLRGYF